MITITAVFLLISGIFAALAKVRKNTKPSEFIAVYILGLSTLILTKDYFFDENGPNQTRSEEHTSELQSRPHLVCRLLLEKKKKIITTQKLTHPACPPVEAALRSLCDCESFRIRRDLHPRLLDPYSPVPLC